MHKTRQQLQQANDQLTQLDCLNSHLRSSISALQRQEEERVAAADQLTQAAEESTSLLSQRIKEHEATIGRLKIQLEQQARGGAHRHEVQVQLQQIIESYSVCTSCTQNFIIVPLLLFSAVK